MENGRTQERDIAIVGYSHALPGGADEQTFWRAMLQGRDFISEASSDRWDWKQVHADGTHAPAPGYSRWAGFLPDIRGFDAGFFRLSPHEARLLDPQQRLLLEGAWQALESSGYAPATLRGSDTGVFVGISTGDYRKLIEQHGQRLEIGTLTGTLSCIAANRISHFFDFHGPSLAVDTACSSGLVALHQAVIALRNGDCALALAGAANVLCSPSLFIELGHGQLLSSTGRCRTFSDDADGYVRGEGAGWIVLKRLDRALEDGDFIHALIKGSALNHGGQVRTLTAPNPYAQSQVIVRALLDAGVRCDTIGYVEAHGTATPLGDAIEAQGLVRAFSHYAKRHDIDLPAQYCGLGSIKTNIGHLEAASGIASVIKVLLALRYKQLPPLANFQAKNPRIKVEGTPFRLVDGPAEWTPLTDAGGNAMPRRAGVSAFGFGGTNVHLVMEEYEARPPVRRAPDEPPARYPVPLSANSEASLRACAARLLAHLGDGADIALPDVVHTLQAGRDAMRCRAGFVAGDDADLTNKLSLIAAGCFDPDGLRDASEPDAIGAQVRQWLDGGAVAWTSPGPAAAARRIPLPTYVFDHTPYFLEMDAAIPPAPILESNVKLPVLELLANILTGTAGVPPGTIGHDDDFEKIGLDSYLVYEISFKLEQHFGTLPKTLFFEYPSLSALADYFVEHHADTLSRMFGDAAGRHEPAHPAAPAPARAPVPAPIRHAPVTAAGSMPIAIVGVSGRYPMADTLDEFWDNLVAGRDCITEIPEDRWPHRDNFDPDRSREGTIYGKWGGFIRGHDEFDPLFFNIAPRDAELMSPQERVFLQTAWHTVEDAGYARPALKGKDVGVFVGVMWGDYDLVGAEATLRGHPVATDAAYWAIANRVSYIFDWHGPSVAIDTACSSSLTAIHFACQSLALGECEMALAGGVNLSLHSRKYLQLSQEKFLSTDGRCRSFGAGGDGYVPGEGSGAVLLKPLEHAIRDGDIIHGVIRGSSVNHGGKVSGFRVPNPNAQARLIDKAFERAGLSPRTLGYLEAHGTGTALGDPIELAALRKAFARHTPDRNFCALGSVKSNIGHLEAAAGIAGLTKVLLQFQHGKLVPSLHADTVNPEIDLADSPFVLQKETADWTPPAGATDVPRRAGVSSFGAGGANAHVIVDDYVAPCRPANAAAGAQLFVLSAKTEERLRAYAGNWVRYIERKQGTDLPSLQDIAYTLATGREAMPVRLALIVSDTTEACDLLKAYLDGRSDAGRMFAGHVRDASQALLLPTDEEGKAYLDALVSNRRLARLAAFWVAGAPIDWPLLHRDSGARRVALPGYPFAAKRFWVVPDGQSAGSAAGFTDVRADVCADVRAEPVPAAPSAPPPEAAGAPADDGLDLYERVRAMLGAQLSGLLKIDTGSLDDDTSFEDYGADSVMIAEIVKRTERLIGTDLEPWVVLEHASLARLSRFIVDHHADRLGGLKTAPAAVRAAPVPPARPVAPAANSGDIAVIGIACRFPGADDKEQFWQNLCAGVDSVTEIAPDRWDIGKYYQAGTWQRGKSISKWGGFISGIDLFDAEFFKFKPDMAAQTDPLARLFLETGYQTLMDAGYTHGDLAGKSVGVFVGTRATDYITRIQEFSKEGVGSAGQNLIASHLSHFFNFKGPSLVVDTACSSSLVSVHLACQQLRAGECDYALAGGVDLLLDERPYLLLSQAQALSPKGRCFTFDSRADGFVPGEGAGAVLLKPLEHALRDGDRIYAVIESSATNNDGHTMGLTTPNMNAQIDVIEAALKRKNIDPASIAYVEAHGTGTMIGDPIELKALTEVYRRYTDRTRFCAVGSVKTNIGHLLSAAGIASFIKVCLGLSHRTIPPSLHCETPNSRFAFDSSPFYPNRSLTDWECLADVRRAAISSFGFGGTNAHMILREHDTPPPAGVTLRQPRPPAVFRRQRYWIDAAGHDGVPHAMPEQPRQPAARPAVLQFSKIAR